MVKPQCNSNNNTLPCDYSCMWKHDTYHQTSESLIDSFCMQCCSYPNMSFTFQDLTLRHGWRTGAIIPELRKEIKIMNTEQYVHMMAWLQALTGLIEQMQVIKQWKSVFSFFFPSCQKYVLNFSARLPTGTSGSSISSCCWRVDQRKRWHEVKEVIILEIAFDDLFLYN